MASVRVDPPGGTSQLGSKSSGRSGEYREVVRYQFAPAGVAPAASNIFYVYVSHYKSGASSTSNNTNSRAGEALDRKSTRLNSSHLGISYAVFCLKKKKCEAAPRNRHSVGHISVHPPRHSRQT